MTSDLIRVDWSRLTVDSVIIPAVEITTTENAQGNWIRGPYYPSSSSAPMPVPYTVSPPIGKYVSSWDELQMGESIYPIPSVDQRRENSNREVLRRMHGSKNNELDTIPTTPLNPGGDSAIRKLL